MSNNVFVNIATTVNGRPARLPVPGGIVAPGLAVTMAHINGRPVLGGYTVIHIASGLNISPLIYCWEHIQAATWAAVISGLDWTQPWHILSADPLWDAIQLDLSLWVSCTHKGPNT